MKLTIRNIERMAKRNSPVLFTVAAVVVVGATAYLTAKATFKAAKDLEEIPEDTETIDKVKHVWKHYIPPTVSGALTVGSMVSATRAGSQKTSAAIAAYSVTEKAFSEYKRHVLNELGEGKEQRVRDEIIQKRVDENPMGDGKVLVTGGGDTLCCELHTKRYFMCSMETLKRAMNNINARINNEYYVSLDEFYYEIGLEPTTQSTKLGWDSDRLLDLEFSATIADDGRPCIAFAYNYIKPI